VIVGSRGQQQETPTFRLLTWTHSERPKWASQPCGAGRVDAHGCQCGAQSARGASLASVLLCTSLPPLMREWKMDGFVDSLTVLYTIDTLSTNKKRIIDKEREIFCFFQSPSPEERSSVSSESTIRRLLLRICMRRRRRGARRRHGRRGLVVRKSKSRSKRRQLREPPI